MSVGEEMIYLKKRRKEGGRGGKLNVDVYGGLDISAKNQQWPWSLKDRKIRGWDLLGCLSR
jgi:hypothetical protein